MTTDHFSPISQSNRIQVQIKRHPLISFVLLSYAISWSFWILLWFLKDTGPTTKGFSVIAGMGPALAAVILSAILQPERSEAPAKKYWLLFVLVWFGTLGLLYFQRVWGIMGLVSVVSKPVREVIYPNAWAFLLDALAASVVSWFISGVRSRWSGVRIFLHSFDLGKSYVRWYWFILAVGVYPAVMLLGNTISDYLNMPMPAPRAAGEWYWLLLDYILLFLVVLFGGGGFEEPGWRGYALPILQKRYNLILSSLVLAVIWAFWHWPLFWFGFYEGGPMGVFFYVLGVAPLAILLTAVYNRTGGSLPIVILLHTSINTTPAYIPATPLSSGLWMFLMLVVALWMWRSPQTFLSREDKTQDQGLSLESGK
jgi:membrane protease YdiL (CAAX protease family)